MTNTIDNNIDFYDNLTLNNYDFKIYKVNDKTNINYLNPYIWFSSVSGDHIILNDNDKKNIITPSIIDIHLYLYNHCNLY